MPFYVTLPRACKVFYQVECYMAQATMQLTHLDRVSALNEANALREVNHWTAASRQSLYIIHARNATGKHGGDGV